MGGGGGGVSDTTITDVSLLVHRESLAQLVEAGKRVVDSPTHLADFGVWTLMHTSIC